MNTPHIVFDVGKLLLLKNEYEASLTHIRQLLPQGVNWNSQKQVKAYFKSLHIELPDCKIETLAGQQSQFEHDPELFDLFTGVLQYFKLRAVLNNYLNNILKHLDSKYLYLREVNGTWCLPNKRPLFHNLEVWSCVKGFSAELIPLVTALNRP